MDSPSQEDEKRTTGTSRMGEVKKEGGDRRDSRRNGGGQSWEDRTREDMRRKTGQMA